MLYNSYLLKYFQCHRFSPSSPLSYPIPARQKLAFTISGIRHKVKHPTGSAEPVGCFGNELTKSVLRL
jgi:hypothetical protein